MVFISKIIGVFFVYSVFAQEPQKYFETQNQCETVKRLDAKGGPLENQPIQDQGPLSTCYANTSSVVLLTKLKKENPNLKIDQLSWVYLAYLTKKHHFQSLQKELDGNISKSIFEEGADMCRMYESIKGKKICSIDKNYWDDDLYKKSLEGNAETLQTKLNEYSDFLQTDDLFEKYAEIEEILSPSCFTSLDEHANKFVTDNFEKFLNNKAFSNIWGELAEPKAENLKKFKQVIANRYIKDNFQLNQNTYSSSKVLKENFDGTHLTLREEDEKILFSILIPNNFSNQKLSSHFYDFYFDFLTQFQEENRDAVSTFKNQSDKNLISCIDQVLSGASQISLSPNTCANLNHEPEAIKIAKFVEKMLASNFNPKHIMMLINDRDISSKLAMLDTFMNAFYDDCNIAVASNWNCGYYFKEDLEKNAPEKQGQFIMDVAQVTIDGGEANYLALESDFFKTDASINESDAKSKKEAPSTHAVSIIGYAKNCGVQKQCILIQNSEGENIHSEEDRNEKIPSHLIPAEVTVQKYTNEEGKEEEYKMYGYGKFWVCDPEKIKKYFFSLNGFAE